MGSVRQLLLLALMLLPLPAYAGDTTHPAAPACAGTDKACLLGQLERETAAIPETEWRDATYRELAKLLTRQGEADQAIALVDKVQTPDTKAMTIRGIAKAAADMKLPKAQADAVFTPLIAKAEQMKDAPSRFIALNYIAVAEAIAGDDDGAMKIARGMQNAEMRNKAFYDMSKEQALRGRLPAALASTGAIDDLGFRDKARQMDAQLFADGKAYDAALKIGGMVQNPYKRAQALLYILTRQIAPEEVSLE